MVCLLFPAILLALWGCQTKSPVETPPIGPPDPWLAQTWRAETGPNSLEFRQDGTGYKRLTGADFFFRWGTTENTIDLRMYDEDNHEFSEKYTYVLVGNHLRFDRNVIAVGEREFVKK